MSSVLAPECDSLADTQALYRANVWLRDLLIRVDHVAVLEQYRPHTGPLLWRAQRIRQWLHQGVPEGWRAER